MGFEATENNNIEGASKTAKQTLETELIEEQTYTFVFTQNPNFIDVTAPIIVTKKHLDKFGQKHDYFEISEN